MINKAKEFLGIGKDGKYELMDYYNNFCYLQVAANRKYKIRKTDDWCAMFTTVIAHMCGLNAHQFPFEVSVWYQAQIAKERGLWFTDPTKATPNDLIVYDWKKGNRYNHVGFVVSNEGGFLRVIEGNKNDTVGYRTVKHTSTSIQGFIRVAIDDFDTGIDGDLRIAMLAIAVLKGQLGNGLERKQRLGVDYDAVQKLVNG